jgi:hypothetical protein
MPYSACQNRAKCVLSVLVMLWLWALAHDCLFHALKHSQSASIFKPLTDRGAVAVAGRFC